jgi:hypothetical protein
MSNHFSADNLKFPGDDRRLDLTDVFVFKSPDDPDKTVLIIDSNPTSAPPPITCAHDRPGIPSRRGLPDQHRHRRRRAGRRRVHVHVLRIPSRQADRDRPLRHRPPGPRAWTSGLPDILHYDRTKPAAYPNGRVPADDVYSMRFAWLTDGRIPPTGLKPHDDLLAHFPTWARLTPDACHRGGLARVHRDPGHPPTG